MSEPNRPCDSPKGPAVKYTVLAAPPAPPLPTFSAHSPSITMGSPSGSLSWPSEYPLFGVEGVDAPVAEVTHQQHRIVVVGA